MLSYRYQNGAELPSNTPGSSPSPLPQQTPPGDPRVKILVGVIGVLLVMVLLLGGYITLLLSHLDKVSKGSVATTTPSLTSPGNVDTANQVGSLVAGNAPPVTQEPTSGGSVQQITKQELIDKSPFKSVFIDSLRVAKDTKRKADLLALGTAFNLYYMEAEDQLPSNFPTTPKCIGNGQGCFDAYKLLVPNYLAAPLMDDAVGTPANSGYLVAKSHDGITNFILQATNEDGTVMEIKK